jgi:hypothetical protein
LRSGQGKLQTGGSSPLESVWFAARLAQRHPGEVYSFIVDAPGAGAAEEFVPYNGTRLVEAARTVLPAGRYALRANTGFDFLSRPIQENPVPGTSFDILPANYRLKDVIDEYIHLGN